GSACRTTLPRSGTPTCQECAQGSSTATGCRAPTSPRQAIGSTRPSFSWIPTPRPLPGLSAGVTPCSAIRLGTRRPTCHETSGTVLEQCPHVRDGTQHSVGGTT